MGSAREFGAASDRYADPSAAVAPVGPVLTGEAAASGTGIPRGGVWIDRGR